MLSQKYYYTRIGQANDLKNAKERAIYRIFETLPAILAWGTLLGTIFLSYFAPCFCGNFYNSFRHLLVFKNDLSIAPFAQRFQ